MGRELVPGRVGGRPRWRIVRSGANDLRRTVEANGALAGGLCADKAVHCGVSSAGARGGLLKRSRRALLGAEAGSSSRAASLVNQVGAESQTVPQIAGETGEREGFMHLARSSSASEWGRDRRAPLPHGYAAPP